MEIRGSSGSVWVEALDPYPGDEPPLPGVIQLPVDVSSGGFTGCMFPWVEATALRAFLAALESMQGRRTGEAVLPGVVGEFGLRIAWEQRADGPHLAATGWITSYADSATDGGPHANVLRFGLDFSAAALPGVVSATRAMAEGRA